MSSRIIAPNEVIFCEGDLPGALYIIKSGRVRLVKQEGARYLCVSILGEKDFLGDLSVFTREKQKYTAIADGAVELVVITKSEIETELTTVPAWAKDLVSTLGKRLDHSEELVREHHLEDDEMMKRYHLSHEDQMAISLGIEKFKLK